LVHLADFPVHFIDLADDLHQQFFLHRPTPDKQLRFIISRRMEGRQQVLVNKNLF